MASRGRVEGRGPLVALAVTGISTCVGVYFARRRRSSLALTRILNKVSLGLVALAVVPIVAFAFGSVGAERVGTDSSSRVMLTARPGPTPDIYHLVFDRYGSQSALEALHGIDNSDMVAWLEGQGFHVAKESRANHLKTIPSLASTLSLSLLHDLAEDMPAGSGDLRPLYERISNSKVGSLLQGLGYRYTHIGSWYERTRDSAIADNVIKMDDSRSFASVLMERSILSIGSTPLSSNQELARATIAFQLDELEMVAQEPGPKYVFAHILLPHPPFIFLADGTYAPDDATFESQLLYTNRLIQGYVSLLLDVPDSERPIIILQGDEGPYPTRFAKDQHGFDWATATDEELLSQVRSARMPCICRVRKALSRFARTWLW